MFSFHSICIATTIIQIVCNLNTQNGASIVCRSPSSGITAPNKCAQLHPFRLQYPTYAISMNSLYPTRNACVQWNHLASCCVLSLECLTVSLLVHRCFTYPACYIVLPRPWYCNFSDQFQYFLYDMHVANRNWTDARVYACTNVHVCNRDCMFSTATTCFHFIRFALRPQ